MLCPDCNTYAAEDDIVCPRCGKLLDRQAMEEEELMRFRQGRHLRKAEESLPPPPIVPGSTGASRSFEDTRPRETAEDTGAVYSRRESLASTGRYYGLQDGQLDETPLGYEVSGNPTIMASSQRHPRARRAIRMKRLINWAYVLLAGIVLVIALAIGTFLFLTQTPSGQVVMARMGRDATSAALWQVGQEYMKVGDIERAIAYFSTARAKDTEAKTPNVTGLLEMGSAYEAAGLLTEAEEVYAYIYTEVVPSAPEAYRAQVRVLLAQGREADAAALLAEAYTQTGVASFRTQRLEILPEVPSTSVVAGYYTAAQTIELLQGQDCEIWYSLDRYAVLPEEGILYEDPLEFSEGEHSLRAVAVNGDLVSDVMIANYQIYLPTPLQPDSNLAPNTYSGKRKVTLRPGSLTDEELEKNPGYKATLTDPVAQTITIYYTIDGSQPDLDSPIWDGTPIQMGLYGGYQVLKAVSVNGYGKQGNTLVRTYKFETSPGYRKVYSVEDVIGNLKLGTTTREDFRAKYGEGRGPEMVILNTVEGECEKYTYDWGYASFMKSKSGWVLADLMFTSSQFDGPRGTRIGMAEEKITALYKDFGQVVGATGIKRGLYYVSEDEQGVISILSTGEKVIYYRTGTAEGHVWQLEYSIGADGNCHAIRWFYER
ncbi:MAG: chitobiase/beta-hexosaminidase C-terminal domain-containing protein [Aristaeellaceae bacterium]